MLTFKSADYSLLEAVERRLAYTAKFVQRFDLTESIKNR